MRLIPIKVNSNHLKSKVIAEDAEAETPLAEERRIVTVYLEMHHMQAHLALKEIGDNTGFNYLIHVQNTPMIN